MANMLDKRDRSLAPIPGTTTGADKLDKFAWARPVTSGTMKAIHKNMLNLDDRYQRDKSSEEAVKRIARSWDWTLFGVIKVACREDQSLWVFDGGHRLRASFYRSDITELPCIVFPLADIADEARAFIAGAKMSTSIKSIDTFRAATVALEPGACRTAALLSEQGLKVVKSAHRHDEIKCVHTVQRAVEEDEDTARRALAACRQMTSDDPVNGIVFRALFRLAKHFNGKDILSEHQETLLSLSQAEVEKAVRQMKAETGKGGETVEAKALMGLLNKGKRTKKLVW